jgi:hypothetical protein
MNASDIRKLRHANLSLCCNLRFASSLELCEIVTGMVR